MHTRSNSFSIAVTRCICVLATTSLLFGCGTILTGTTETIRVKSEVPDAQIYVNDAYIGTREAVVTLKKRGREPIIRVTKAGCADGFAVVPKTFNELSLLGLLIDLGLISILVVDLSTGAVKTFTQVNFTVNPSCDN